MQASIFTTKIKELQSNNKLLKNDIFKGQLQRFHKLSLYDRFTHVENGLDINF